MRDLSPAQGEQLFALSDVRRHWLLWPRPHCRPAIIRQVNDPKVRAAVDHLLLRGCPLVARRQSREMADDSARAMSIDVALSLPPGHAWRRLALALPSEWTERITPPLDLARVAESLSEPWRGELLELSVRAAAIDIRFHVYGSAAWEALTGEPYLTPDSDVDLLWHPWDEAQLNAGIALLHAWEESTGRSADGEIVFGDDAAVAWREWDNLRQAQTVERVLVKTFRSAKLVQPSALFRLLASAHST